MSVPSIRKFLITKSANLTDVVLAGPKSVVQSSPLESQRFIFPALFMLPDQVSPRLVWITTLVPLCDTEADPTDVVPV